MGKNFFLTLALTALIMTGICYLVSKNNKITVPNTDCKNCNLVMIDLDVLRYDAIDCVNNFDRTPNICKLKGNSVSFENHANQSSQTITSFVTTMASLYPSSHNVWNEIYDTNLKNVKYLAEILKDNSYKTALAGHVFHYIQVVDKGYEEVIDARHVFSPDFKPLEWVNELSNSGKPFFLHIYLDDTHFPYLLLNDQIIQNPYLAPKGIPKTASEFVRMQADYVTKNYRKIFTEEAINNNKELFTGDLVSKKEDILAFFLDSASKAGKVYLVKDAWAPTRDTFFQNFDKSNPEHIKYLKANYMGIVKLVDQQLGPLLETLQSERFSKNTIVVFKTAHGEEFLEHGSFQHGNDLYQELIHTPLIVKVPGVKAGAVYGLTEDVDVMPTVLDILGIPVPDFTEGKSVRNMLADNDYSVRDYQIAQKGDLNYVSVFRKGDRKITIKQDTPVAIYNLKNDPGEKTNLIGNELELARQLFREYHAVVDPLPLIGDPRSPLPTFIDQQKRQRLKDEGYF